MKKILLFISMLFILCFINVDIASAEVVTCRYNLSLIADTPKSGIVCSFVKGSTAGKCKIYVGDALGFGSVPEFRINANYNNLDLSSKFFYNENEEPICSKLYVSVKKSDSEYPNYTIDIYGFFNALLVVAPIEAPFLPPLVTDENELDLRNHFLYNFDQDNNEDDDTNNGTDRPATESDFTGNLSCGKTSFQFHKSLPNFTSTMYDILKIVTPIIVIITGMLDLLKAVSAQKEDEIKKGQQKLLRRLLAGAIVFLVFVIVETAVNIFADNSDASNAMHCVNCFLGGANKCTKNTASPNTPSSTSNKFYIPFPSNTNFSITSEFGKRINPITNKEEQMHYGIDLGAPAGTKILAVASGTVIQAGYDNSMGNYAMIEHTYNNSKIYATYMHMSQLDVSANQKVSAKQKIGIIGTTGDSTGIHLHLEFSKTPSVHSANSVNPKNYINFNSKNDDTNITFSYNYYTPSNTMPYGIFTPSSASSGEKKPLIIWFHGAGERNISKEAFKNSGLLKVLSDWNLDGFDAYVLCPHLAGNGAFGRWDIESTQNSLKTLIDKIKSEANIDTSKIILVGHSLGSQAVQYMGARNDSYSALVVLSGYPANYTDQNTLSKINIPTLGYVGTIANGEFSDSYNYMIGTFKNAFGNNNLTVLKTNHGGVPQIAFTTDENKDNKSDLIEWMLSQ